MRTLVAYVPVLHEGYRRFFTKYDGPKELYLVGSPFVDEDKALAKDIRRLEPALMQRAVEALGIFERVAILGESAIQELNNSGRELVLPDEDISRELAEKYFANAQLTFDPIFLRWDRKNAQKEKELMPDRRITQEEFHRQVMAQAEGESHKSSDNWRHVGAALVQDRKVVLLAYNKHVPSPHSPYANGDPRSNWSQGVEMDLATGFHAEASIIAEAAKRGIALERADLYVTVFPCPPCTKLIAYSGIKHLYCGGGKPILDSEEILKGKGIEIIFVE